MRAIEVNSLTKCFKTLQKDIGIKNSLKSLFKREYRNILALDDISFSIEEGEVIGLIGLNGAGKTTLLKCLAGLIYPTKGEIKVLNTNPWNKENDFLKNIGFIMGQRGQLSLDLSAIDALKIEKEIYEIDDEWFKEELDELCQLMRVDHLLKTQLRKVSLGERMKLEIISVLLHKPELILLDEPTIGLDFIAQDNIRKFLIQYNNEHNSTMIVTSHNLVDIEKLCSKILLLNNGKLIYDGSLENFKRLYATPVGMVQSVPRMKPVLPASAITFCTSASISSLLPWQMTASRWLDKPPMMAPWGKRLRPSLRGRSASYTPQLVMS